MPFILITGTSTSGKSSIAKELLERGYEAYDTEHDGISAYFNKETGQRVAEFGGAPERSKSWLDQHEWLISPEWLKEKAEKAKESMIFACGGTGNPSAILPFFDKVIWLEVDEQTIRYRVNNPRDHDYGTKPHELAAAIRANTSECLIYKNAGAQIVDATQPLNKVVDEILAIE